MPENNDKKKLQDLYNEYNIPLPEEKPVRPRPQSAPAKPANTAPKSDIPRKPDGTSYTMQELQQIQAYRAAMRQRRNGQAQNTARPSARPEHPEQQRAVRQGQAMPSQSAQNRPQEPRRQQQANGHYYGQKQDAAVPKYRRRKLSKPNPAALIFTLLIVVISAFSIGQIIQNNRTPGNDIDHSSPGMIQNNDDALANLPGSETAGDTEETAEGIDDDAMVLWNTVQVSNDTLDEGDLILVNYEYAYADADTISPTVLYGVKADTYQVSSTNISLLPVALEALNNLANDFHAETGSREIIIVSGYRDVASQKSIYDSRVASQGEEMAKLYVATPGYSEHHTGLAIDMSFYTTAGASVAVEDHEFGYWIHENCDNYGFVLRYPDDKVDITQIGYESWHYRYVGLPHAAIMSEKNLCLEEYIAYLREYTPSTKLIWIQKDGVMAEVSPTAFPKEGTLVYFVPAAEGETTDIRLPRGNIFEKYEISGNNVDGFIVTVRIG
ncbi:MAG: D-alanyl-D-alanine carboxypeptidase family protein [Clostridia bacterium]|nr:D-alanyl-D-alanine carboxypeptidase family protein [Clostridia bacterium]